MINYFLRSTVINERVGGLEYKTNWIGDTVISIEPCGGRVPLYQRSEFLKTGAGTKLSGYTPEFEINL